MTRWPAQPHLPRQTAFDFPCHISGSCGHQHRGTHPGLVTKASVLCSAAPCARHARSGAPGGLRRVHASLDMPPDARLTARLLVWTARKWSISPRPCVTAACLCSSRRRVWPAGQAGSRHQGEGAGGHRPHLQGGLAVCWGGSLPRWADEVLNSCLPARESRGPARLVRSWLSWTSCWRTGRHGGCGGRGSSG